MERKGNFRPAFQGLFPCMASGNILARGEIAPDGRMSVDPLSGTNGWFSWDRVSFTSGDTPLETPVYENGWTTYDSTYFPAGYRIDSQGIVHLQGVVKGGAVGSTIFTLPEGYRPGDSRLFVTISGNGFGRINITSDGRVYIYNGVTDWISLDGISFPVTDSWISPGFINGWTDYGGLWAPAGYIKDDNGVVHLKGLVKGGSLPADIFVLPGGYRPSSRLLIPVASDHALGRCDIEADGSVIAQGGSNAWFSLDGISFVDAGTGMINLPKGDEWARYDTTYGDLKCLKADGTVYLSGVVKEGLSPGICGTIPQGYSYSQEENLQDKPVKAGDWTEAMDNGNAARAEKGLSPVSWTEDTPAAETNIRKQHLEDLRSTVSGLVSYGGSDFPFSDPFIMADVTAIRAVHMEEVRQVIDDSGTFARCAGCSSYCGNYCSGQCAVSCDVSCNTTCSGDCQSGCSESCRDACSYYCHTACSGTCYTNCSGGCTRNNCAGDNCGPGCTQSCHGSCNWTCVGGFFVPHGVCSGDCWGTCSSKCYGGCTGSCGATSCTWLCHGSCFNNCYNQCTGCANTCESDCRSSCSEHCYSGCSTECDSNCTDECYLNCNSGCVGNCFDSCLSGCLSGCSFSARHGVDPGSY